MGEKRNEVKDNGEMAAPSRLRGYQLVGIDDRFRSSSHGARWYTGNPHDKFATGD